ncbi:sulfate adenylyltransferase subunit CysD [Lentisphaera profundi]|uniref:Sulfate adenylyltransferase subunit 2 n=2 Tax=Lentisphaera profundi TaxID=1658616 RepID=A0ABY7W1N9_9BACT|nr:sulfate adenylyltransferase subunit CysD [Lentisphaera profundi]WDE98188.1 sulfate adenylyltransferase subunit CysD [Lentisphaera profundi]
MSQLDQLEAEAIHIIREAVAQAENPVMLYSVGKDSAVMVRLAQKAFAPGPVPFPLLHIDSQWKFKEMIQFRDKFCEENGLKLLVHYNKEGKAAGVGPFTHGSRKHTDIMKTQALVQSLEQGGYDMIFGGARRDEEKSRAKERIYSFRDKFNQWDPKNQRPEVWSLYNGKINPNESVRVFPISNWTEMDVWRYIERESIPIVPLYFAKKRPYVEIDGNLIMVDDDRMPLEGREVKEDYIRFRTLGCYPLTGGVLSTVTTMAEMIEEMINSDISERNSRVIDFDGEASMEQKKREGYF